MTSDPADRPWRRRRLWAGARLLGGAVILSVILWRLGTGPFVDAVHLVDGVSLAAAAGIAALTTLCCAWRWSLIAGGLGVWVPLRAAVPAYYRSQFLNTTLPGGVLGDVHRALRHGQDVGDRSRALRAVAWERAAGQAVQLAATVTVLLLLPSPVHSLMPAVATAIGAGGSVAVVVILRRSEPNGSSRWARTVRAATEDLRAGLLSRRAWPRVVLASAVVVAGHAGTFLIAARAAGTTAPIAQMLPLALLVLVAIGVPASIAGWGPREGAAAWVFGAAGLGAGQGVTTAVVYGVLALVATAPGAVVLVADRFPRAPRGAKPGASPGPRRLSPAGLGGGAGG